MESERLIIKQGDGSRTEENRDTAHRESVEFVEQNRDIFEHQARGRVQFEAAPPGLDTFAFDLEADPPKIYINSRFYKKRELSDAKTAFATMHEIQHLLEKKQLLAEKSGDKIFRRYLEKIKASRAFNFMDNRVADLRENKAVVLSTHEEFDTLRRSLYKEDLVPETDFTAEPGHIQFVEAFSREGEVPDEQCAVSPEVRAKLDEVKKITGKNGSRLVDVMTHPNTPMSTRLKLQDRYIWPIIEELRKKDVEDKKNEGKDKKGGQDRKGSDNGERGQAGEGKSGKKKKGKWQFGKSKKDKPEEKPSEAGAEEENLDPNEIFKEAYERASNRVPNAVPIEELERAFKKWKESVGDPIERADKEYADKLGVKVEDLKRYRSIAESIQKIINPETRESVIEELKNLFNRIIARRLKPTPAPKYPMEEGEDLVDPAGLISGVKGGDLEPKVWETTESIERTGQKFGEVEITLVFDRSGSMTQGSKLPEQRKAGVMAGEALKDFGEQCDEERVNMTKPLEIRTEVFSFQATTQDSEPLKKMSKEFSEKERIDVSTVLSSAPGPNTTDFITLETIEKGMNEEIRRKIKEGELKKIVIVFTDGESGGPDRVKNVLEKLRKAGVAAIGVGITEAGRAALNTYAPDARLAEKAEDLAIVLADLLKEHLAYV